ncbi:MAG: winged helix-turn-helix domain-containing protein [Chloroflexales bacterium]|nr:winged helix-turn-helix domain-containing protein [Chloroflexales bacterium]
MDEQLWRQQAYEAANLREKTLRQQVRALLNLVGESGTSETQQEGEAPPCPAPRSPLHGIDEPEESFNLWQRIQGLLGRKSSSPSLAPTEVTEDNPLESTSPEQSQQFSLVIYCLGNFRVYRNACLITDWNGVKARSLLKYLVTYRNTPVAKDILLDVFWPEADPKSARRSLHQAVYSLRQTLRQGEVDFQPILFERDRYALNVGIGIWLDCAKFEAHVQAGQRLEGNGRLAEAIAEYRIAESLYQGDFMEEDLYDDWPRVEQERLKNIYLDIANRLSSYYLRRRDHDEAVTFCQKLLARDPCHEETHRQLMRCYLARGQRHLAVRQYQSCLDILRAELNLTPSTETVTLYQSI